MLMKCLPAGRAAAGWVGCLGVGLLMLLARPAAAQGPALPDRPAAVRDSLRRLLQTSRPADTTRVSQLNALAFALRTNEAPQTRQLARQALHLAQRLHYDRGLLNAHFSLGYYYRGSSQYDSAIYHTREALRLAVKSGRNYDRTRGLYNLARIYYDKGDYSSALATNMQGLALARAISNRRAEAFHLVQSGLIKTALGEWEAARLELDQALRISQSLKDYIGMGHAYGGLGDLNRQQARWNLAGQYYTEAAASYQHVYNNTGLLAVQLDIAEMTDRQGNHEAARRAAVRLLRLARQAEMNRTIIRAQLLLGRICLAANQADSALLYGQQSLAATRRHGLRPETLEAAHLLAHAYAQRGRWNSAYRYQVLASLYVDSLTGEATRRRVAGLQGQAARSQQAHQLLLLRQRARLQQQQQELARLRYRQQVGALAGLAGLVLALSGGVLWHDRRRERHRQEALRTRIAADLHDEVGSILTQISMQSTLLREGAYPPPQQQAYLDQMAEASRRAARQMSDAVWSIDARYDSARSLLDRLRDHAHEVLSAAGLEIDFGADPSLATAAVPLATRQALYFIYKEALHNVVKHAQAQQVRVRLRRVGWLLELEIQDDGRGLPPHLRAGGQGLANMRMRAAAVGGSAVIQRLAAGTGVVVRLPL